MIWYQVKLLAAHATSLSMDALHIVAGTLLSILIAVGLRTSVANWRPWLVVLALELANEANDLWVEVWPDPAAQYGESLKDIASTMFLPTLLVLLARARPGLFVRRSADDEVAGGPDIGLGARGSPRHQDQRDTGGE
ncbi:MAG: hypothetical protein H0W65_00820 [Sphingomonas sp.]|uniref:hypothetical protein n=1 Tax=Sphingomonas sp. TaxID=28214 RepID=UPI0017EFEA2F|nr:hypothetical protein [Sphingomonas sp.]MBA3666253.1 hypothetical protein [Sphingomonas sp.]